MRSHITVNAMIDQARAFLSMTARRPTPPRAKRWNFRLWEFYEVRFHVDFSIVGLSTEYSTGNTSADVVRLLNRVHINADLRQAIIAFASGVKLKEKKKLKFVSCRQSFQPPQHFSPSGC